VFIILERMRAVMATAKPPNIDGCRGVKSAFVHVFTPGRVEIGRVRSIDSRVDDASVQ